MPKPTPRTGEGAAFHRGGGRECGWSSPRTTGEQTGMAGVHQADEDGLAIRLRP